MNKSDSHNLNKLLPDIQTAKILDTTTGTLAVWRSTGRIDLPYIKVGKNVRYRYGDILDFIDRHTMTQTT